MTEPQASAAAARYTEQIVTQKTVWLSDKLFSLTITRPPGFQFLPGQFARLGLAVDPNTPLTPSEWRAYSMVSAPSADELEFFSVVVPEGKFSPAMARLRVGDSLWINKTVFGFLTLESFSDGEDLWLLSTGTGLSAYLSMLRDPATFKRFKRIVVVHGVRQACELAYRNELLALMEQNKTQLIYLPSTTRESLTLDLSPSLSATGLAPARLTTLLASGQLEQRSALLLDPNRSRVMLCGNPAMVTEMRALLAQRGFAAGRRGVAGNLAVENYW
ncbi:MAG: ferredoxin--NADP reductase [Alcaligenaceae bacterium]